MPGELHVEGWLEPPTISTSICGALFLFPASLCGLRSKFFASLGLFHIFSSELLKMLYKKTVNGQYVKNGEGTRYI